MTLFGASHLEAKNSRKVQTKARPLYWNLSQQSVMGARRALRVILLLLSKEGLMRPYRSAYPPTTMWLYTEDIKGPYVIPAVWGGGCGSYSTPVRRLVLATLRHIHQVIINALTVTQETKPGNRVRQEVL